MNEIRFRTGTAAEVLAGLPDSADALRSQLSLEAADDQSMIVMARFDDAVVGYIAATADDFGGYVVWEHLVLPEYRGNSVGRRLLLEIAKRASPMARLSIDPTGDFDITAVVGYYAGLGFPAISDDKLEVNAPAHKVVDAIGERAEEDTTLRLILRRKPAGVITVDRTTPIRDAVALLHDKNVGSVVVSQDSDTIDGIFSERDLVVCLHNHGPSVIDQPVGDHMTPDVVSANVTDLIAEVMEVVSAQRLRHIAVTEGEQLVGIVSVGDLLMFRMREHDMSRDGLPYRG